MGERITKNNLKKLFSSNYTLALAIVNTIVVISSILLNIQDGGNWMSAIIFNVFAIISCVGIWLIYNSARNKDEIYTTGFTLIKINVIYEFAIEIIIAIFFVLGGISLLILENMSEGKNLDFDSLASIQVYGTYSIEDILNINNIDSEWIMGLIGIVGVMFIIIGLAVLILAILYYAYLLKTIKSIRRTAETGIPDTYVSMLVRVMMIIMASLMAIFALSSIVYIFMGMFWTFVNVVAAMSWLIIAVIGLFKYKETMVATEKQVAEIAMED